MTWRRAAVTAALFWILGAVSSAAQDVTLTSRDGSVEIAGNLLGFDGEFYRVDTRFGELTVDGSGVLCDGPGCPNLADFVAEVAFSGSSTMAERLMPALIEGFARVGGYDVTLQPRDDSHFDALISDDTRVVARFGFRATTTDEGFADYLARETDIVLALREVRPEERTRIAGAGMGDVTPATRARVLALDAMVPVVAPDNPVAWISPADLSRVFAGEIDNWSALGGPDAPISLHLPEDGSGFAQAAEDYLLAPSGLSLAPDIQRHDRIGALVEAVRRDPFGIGLASLAESGTARTLALTGGCGFALIPDRQSVKTEDYPLVMPMFLYLPSWRLPKLAREFVAYMRSPSAQNVIRRAGFVDQLPEEIRPGAQGERLLNAIQVAEGAEGLAELQRLVTVLKPMSRLSYGFRFEPGSSRPDAQSRSNILELARAIETGAFDTRDIVLVGFSDGDGPAASNLRIARARAQAVRRAVLKAAEAAGEVDIAIEAFGEALPMACEDSDWGRKINRRVEVWLR